jgi:hypothetical protein
MGDGGHEQKVLDRRHRNHDDEISHKRDASSLALRKVGPRLAAGYPATGK